MRKIITYLIFLLLPMLSIADDDYKSDIFTMKNGMQVVVITNTKMPVISHMVWYKIGAADESPGKSGVAHFLEHLMFKSTSAYKSGEFSSKIAKVGGNDNAFTDSDYTAYYQNIPKEALAMVMQLESDRMQHLIVNDEEVLKERDVILEERRARIDNDPGALLQEQMKAALYLNHPYQRPIIGWYHEMAAITAEDARAWYRNYYNPANAVLVVSGDITSQELRPLAEKYYGNIPPGPKILRPIIQEPQHIAPLKIELSDNRVKKNEITRYYLAPSIIYGKKEYSYALVLLSYLLGGSDTGFLYQDMVVKNKKAVYAKSYYDDLRTGPSIFVLRAIPVDGIKLEQLGAEFDTCINRILVNGINDKDLRRAKNAIVAEDIYAREDMKTLAYAYGASVTLGLGTDYVENWKNNINSVTAEEIQAAAKYIFDPRNSVTGYLLSPGKIK